MYIIPMYLRLTTFTKTLPQMSFHLYFFAIFISLWGSTHDSADCWSAHSWRRNSYVGFCLYEEEEEDRHELANRPSHKRPRIDGIGITKLVNGHERRQTATNGDERLRTATNGYKRPRIDGICTAYKHLHVCVMVRVREYNRFQIDISNVL